ncbi:hypothetical protein [Falsiroseomonas tokyonensis]|uniref:Uncharacterized protein n=1 Tax=Falsiroseomonas tokyonensis TaxID=430521 RepID=A0ABV7BSG7_9PROT|nr:hypothetical protein [Falsiroseomonas tokyonensis]MBU8537057.1 hypothetical protein [Falsiroseomonas tokyonensis]
MTAAKLVEVTLAMTWSPAEPEGHAGYRIVFAMALDSQGGPDAAAWLADPDPWPARQETPGEPVRHGDVAHDEEGWSLRFPREGGALSEAPLHRIFGGPGWLRPGEVVTIAGPEGEAAWRIVGVA